MNSLKLALLPLLLLGASHSFAAETTTDVFVGKSYEYKNLTSVIDEEAYLLPLQSTDRLTTTLQAVAVTKKLKEGDVIKSISEKPGAGETNISIEIVDTNTGKCRLLKANVHMGYHNEKGESANQLNTIVEFVKGVSRCK